MYFETSYDPPALWNYDATKDYMDYQRYQDHDFGFKTNLNRSYINPPKLISKKNREADFNYIWSKGKDAYFGEPNPETTAFHVLYPYKENFSTKDITVLQDRNKNSVPDTIRSTEKLNQRQEASPYTGGLIIDTDNTYIAGSIPPESFVKGSKKKKKPFHVIPENSPVEYRELPATWKRGAIKPLDSSEEMKTQSSFNKAGHLNYEGMALNTPLQTQPQDIYARNIQPIQPRRWYLGRNE